MVQTMHSASATRLLIGFLALLGARLGADTVDIENGSSIVGKITKIDAGTVVVSTDYAGLITIKQAQVASMATDAPVAVRLESGTRVDGRLTAGPSGSVQITGAEGAITTTVD